MHGLMLGRYMWMHDRNRGLFAERCNIWAVVYAESLGSLSRTKLLGVLQVSLKREREKKRKGKSRRDTGNEMERQREQK
jgi:hypothetical protein